MSADFMPDDYRGKARQSEGRQRLYRLLQFLVVETGLVFVPLCSQWLLLATRDIRVFYLSKEYNDSNTCTKKGYKYGSYH